MTPQEFIPTSFVSPDGSIRIERDSDGMWHAVAVGQEPSQLLAEPRLTSWCAMVEALEALGVLDDEEPEREDQHDLYSDDLPW